MSGPTIDVDGIEAAKAAAGPRPRPRVTVPPRAPSLEDVRELAELAHRQSRERRARATRNRTRRAHVEGAGVLLLLVAVVTLLGLL